MGPPALQSSGQAKAHLSQMAARAGGERVPVPVSCPLRTPCAGTAQTRSHGPIAFGGSTIDKACPGTGCWRRAWQGRRRALCLSQAGRPFKRQPPRHRRQQQFFEKEERPRATLPALQHALLYRSPGNRPATRQQGRPLVGSALPRHYLAHSTVTPCYRAPGLGHATSHQLYKLGCLRRGQGARRIPHGTTPHPPKTQKGTRRYFGGYLYLTITRTEGVYLYRVSNFLRYS